MPSGRSKTVRLAALFLIWPVAFAALYLYRPVVLDGPILCPVRLGWGVPCPGCGLTRAFSFMTHGEFGAGLRFNAMAPIIAAYLALVWTYYALFAWKGSPPRWPTWRIAGAMMMLVAAFWAGRLAEFFSGPAALETIWHDNGIARLLRLF